MKKQNSIQDNSNKPATSSLRRTYLPIANRLIQQISLSTDYLSKLLVISIVEPMRLMRFYSTVLQPLIQPLGTLFGISPPPQKRLAVRLLDSIWRREWLMVIICGTIAVPAAFYTASILEGVAIIEYTRLATLSWLSFFAGAMLNRLKK